MWADAPAVAAGLSRAARRVAAIGAAIGAAAGLGIAALLVLVNWPANTLQMHLLIGVALAATGVVIGLLIARRRNIAQRIESRAPECRNVVITAAELLAATGAEPAPDTTPLRDYVGALVCRDAAQVLARLDFAALFPARNAALALSVCAVLWLAATVRATQPGSTVGATAASNAAATISGIDVVVTPPPYAGQPRQTLHDPARIEALVGSRIQLTIHADAGAVSLETLHGTAAATRSSGNQFAGEIVADADGYIAIEPATGDGRQGVRRLIGISVTPDNPPHVAITAPARDMKLRDGHATIDVTIAADDDIGLASLRLRYTRVSGAGEQFTFKEGEVPLAIDRASPRNWKAHATWRLDSLALGPGDMVVYRAVAADARPGAAPTESDSYIAEVLAPGGEAAAGVSMDPEEDRYALSEQMVILKTERLNAGKGTLAPQDFADSAANIAAEQRKVRAEFVFMMGGEIGAEMTDMSNLGEEAEAEGEGELMTGRQVNQGRNAILMAIRYMSRAATALIVPDGTEALGDERVALAQLEQAFSHTRIILRALTVRERLDLTRRLTGVLTDATSAVHPSIEAEGSRETVALRQALSGIAGLAGSAAFAADASARASNLAEDVLRVDPSATKLHDVATQLTDAAGAIGRGRTDRAHALLDRAATGLAAALRSELPDAPRAAPAADASRLQGALADALRGTRTGP